ncbi:virginiamycin B lyase family protein [Streptomyces katrae]|uniref:Vgb family protein n=1 Tax=Streptomyces katrae TaxID=68223 RepID=UPI003CCBC75D
MPTVRPAACPSLALAPDRTLWVAENDVGGVARIDPAGTITQHRLSALADRVSGIARAADGTVWFVTNTHVGRLRPDGRITRANFGFPEGIAVGPDGAAWFTTSSGADPAIGRADAATGKLSMMAVLPGAFRFPENSITSGPDQAVWFSQVGKDEGSPDGIGRVSLDGVYTSWPLPPGTAPRGITAGPDGALWFTQRGGIGRITVRGEVASFPIPQAERPSCVVAGPDGALWFTTAAKVGRLAPSGEVTLWSVPDAEQLSALVAVPGGGFWLADSKADVVRRFSPPRGQPTDGTRRR